MKKIVLFVALLVVVFVPAASANRGHHRNAPTAPVLSFSCDGTLCVYAVSPGPLEPLTAYDTSIQFVGTNGAGCNTGTGGWHSDSSGAFVQVLSEDEIKCGGSLGGTVTAWVRVVGTVWDAPAVPGTLVGLSWSARTR